MSVPGQNRASSHRAENERRALSLIQEAIREVRYGVVSIVMQDGLVVQVERTVKQRLLTRREAEVSGGGDGI